MWVSQHPINEAQLAVLRRMFGVDIEVVADTRPFDKAETIVQRYRQGSYDDIIVVAPYSVLDRMVQLGVRPLWAGAEQVSDPRRADWITKGRYYRFIGFKRVKRLALELEDLGPAATRIDSD